MSNLWLIVFKTTIFIGYDINYDGISWTRTVGAIGDEPSQIIGKRLGGGSGTSNVFPCNPKVRH